MYIFKNSEGLALKLLNDNDSQVRFELVEKNREYLRKWLGWLDSIKTVDDIRNYTKSRRLDFANNNGFDAGIYIEGKFAGMIGLHTINWSNKNTSIGYWIGEEFSGKGFMTCACRELINYVYGELGLYRIEIRCAEDNYKSRAIPQRLGFKEEGLLRSAENLYGKFINHIVYSMLRDDWQDEKMECCIKGGG